MLLFTVIFACTGILRCRTLTKILSVKDAVALCVAVFVCSCLAAKIAC